jgi:8-oxo-dGTP pyrophosphatase MutT (NUDIX family)
MLLDDDDVSRAIGPPAGDWRTEEGLRDSAVLVPVVRRGGRDHLVFNRRRDDLPWHAGQVCFPGGARDGDESVVACALRETEEEMGVVGEHVRLLGRLPDRISIAGFRVAVVVGRIDPDGAYRLHEAEVAEAFEVPYAQTLEPARWTYKPTTSDRARFGRIPYFDSGRHVVWGLTGIILRDFVRAVGGFDPPDPGAPPARPR